MIHVLGERWGWQETTARAWLASYAGTPAYEAARRATVAEDRRRPDEGGPTDDDDGHVN
jgi:hypothetical protein